MLEAAVRPKTTALKGLHPTRRGGFGRYRAQFLKRVDVSINPEAKQARQENRTKTLKSKIQDLKPGQPATAAEAKAAALLCSGRWGLFVLFSVAY